SFGFPSGPPVPVPTIGGTVFWQGGSGNWNDATHWSTGAVPGVDADVVIDVPGSVTVTVSAGSPQVRSVRARNDLTIASGASLDVLLGNSSVSGVLTVAPNATLTAQGGTTTLTASGTTKIDGGNLYALDGAGLFLPNATSYLHSPTGNSQART